MRILPTFTEYGAFKYLIDLDGVRYLLRYWWSSRNTSWYLSVYTSDGELIAGGMRLNLGKLIFLRDGVVDERLPPGKIALIDRSGEGRDIETQTELGERVAIIYATEEEIDSVKPDATATAPELIIVPK